jgi:putative PEP-CTERM system TPR-repeat lipoprotein
MELQVPPERVYPALARALLEANSPERVITEFGDKVLTEPAAQADLQTSIGQAYLTTGKKKEARAAFYRALSATPDHPGATLGEARLLAGDGKHKEASVLVEKVLARTPEDPEALYLKGQLLSEAGQTDQAIETFAQVVKLRPRTVAARRELAGHYLLKLQVDDAASQVEALKKIAPKDARVIYLDAQVAAQRGQSTEARSRVHESLKSAPDFVPALVLAGKIEFDSGAYAFAEQFLRRALALDPRESTARRMLVALYLQSGQPARAMEALQPLVAQPSNDPVVLVLAGETYLANKDVKTATTFLERASEFGAPGAAVRTRLAQVRFAAGDTDRALKDLQAISKSEPDQFQADIALITSLMQRHEFDKALEAARTLEKKQPGNPLTFQLLGAVYLAKDDVANARSSFEKALGLKTDYLPALQSLGRLDFRDGDLSAGRKRYEAALAKGPDNAAVLLSYASLLAAGGGQAGEISGLLERALQAAPGAAEPRIALAEYHLRNGDPKKALEVAQQANVVLPNEPRILEVLGIAQQATGNPDQAIQTFGQLARLAPKSLSAQLRRAGAYAAAKEFPQALQILRGAEVLDPRGTAVPNAIASTLVQAGRFDDAIAEARSLQKQRPREAIGYVIEADVLAVQKKWSDSAAMYRAALSRSADLQTADKAVAALMKLDANGQADALVAKWVKESPRDFAGHLYLANAAMARKDYKAALPHLRVLVALKPNEPVLLNNLAWAGAAVGDPEALKHAEAAHRLAPTSANIMDTYGWLLVQAGQTERGIKLLRGAVTLAPAAPELRLHLAKALITAGSKDEARKQLESITSASAGSAAKAEAAALLKSL